MVFKGGARDNKVYAVIAIFIILIIVIAVFFSTNRLTDAIIEEDILGETWNEDLTERDSYSGFLGLEKWVSYTYSNDNRDYPAYVSVTSFKTLFMMNEEEIRAKTLETIEQASEQSIILDEATKITGERVTDNGHKTYYIVYNGSDTSQNPFEEIKIIGETWNCGVSGSSIICIGFAQITDDSATNTDYWEKIIKDAEGTFGLGDHQGEDGLIFNVKCH